MLAERVRFMKDSITLSITAMAASLKQSGHNVIGFGAGEPDFDTPEHIKAAGILAIQSGKNKYTPANGIMELRKAVCDVFQKDQGLHYTPSQVAISCGAKHTIFNILFALINPGDEVLIPTPYWVSYPDQVALAGGTPVFVHTTEATQFKMTPEILKAAITPKTKLLILNSPSNPTGMVYSESELKALGDVIEAHSFWVLSDEIYEKLVYGGHRHISIATLSPGLKEKTIVVNGVSKSYAMTGWRIGYCAGPEALIKGIGTIQSHSTSNPTSVAQWAALEALTGPQTEVETMRMAFDKRRTTMVDFLNQIQGVSCLSPEGAFYAFPSIEKLFGKTCESGVILDSVTFCNFLLKEALVACVPGSGFGQEGYLRLSYATSFESISEGLLRMKTWIDALT